MPLTPSRLPFTMTRTHWDVRSPSTVNSPLRASSLTASERVTLAFTTSGIDGTRGAHVELSSESLGIRRIILHWQAFGPILPFSEVFGGTPDPDVGYSERYGHHLRRGLVIRFPPGSGIVMMDQWNSHRSTPAEGERVGSRPPRPQTVGLFDESENSAIRLVCQPSVC